MKIRFKDWVVVCVTLLVYTACLFGSVGAVVVETLSK